MKRCVFILSCLMISGCSGWNQFSDQNNCIATEQVQRVKRTEPTGFSYMAPAGPLITAPMGSSTVNIRFKHYRLYQCDNGAVWGPL